MAVVDRRGNSMEWYEIPGSITQITIKANGTLDYR